MRSVVITIGSLAETDVVLRRFALAGGKSSLPLRPDAMEEVDDIADVVLLSG